jgi:hypothetical protein
MADGIVQVAPDSTGKKIDSSELTVGANTVERQRINIASATVATDIVGVASVNTDADAGEIALATESYLKAWNGSSWDRVRMFSTSGLQIAPAPAPTATTGAVTTAATTVGPVTMGAYDGLSVVVSGTYAGVNFGFWCSNDNTVWLPVAAVRTDSGLSETTTGVLTANTVRGWDISIGEFNYFRIVSTAFTSGSAAISILPGMFASEPQVAAIAQGPNAALTAAIGNPLNIGAQFNTAPGTATTGQTVALLADANGRLIVGGAAASAAAIAGNPILNGGTFTTTLPTVTTGQAVNLQTTARGEQLVALSSGAVAVAHKAASTAAAATDPALVVSLSPNSPIVLPTPSTLLQTSAATTNATSVKASAGNLLSIVANNTGAAIAYIKLYNSAAAPTVGTTAIVLTIAVPAGGFVNLNFGAAGARFSTGIASAVTNLGTDADTTAVTASQIKMIVSYI